MDDALETLLQAGVAAARAGDAERARPYLLRAVHLDENNIQAWYWLAQVVERPHERELCLENVLTLDPGHMAVQAELAALRRERAKTSSPPFSPPQAGGTRGGEIREAAALEPLPCPYCGEPTEAQDRLCSHCAGELYARRPKSEDHSVYSLGLVVLWFSLANHFWLGLVTYYLFADLASAADASWDLGQTVETVTTFLGVETQALPQVDVALPPVLLGGGLAFLFALLVAWGLYRRLRVFYWLTVGLILLGFLYQVYAAILAEAVSPLRLAVLTGAFLLAIAFAFMGYDEFAWVEERLSADLDRDVDSSSSHYVRGRTYADRGMWAKAAAHWSRAAALSPGHPDYRLALASAYLRLGQPERAREHLAEAQRIEPDHPQLADLLRQV